MIEGEDDLPVGLEVAAGHPGVVEGRVFDETEVADVVGRAVAALDRQGLARRQLGVGLEQRVEGDEGTGVSLAEDPDAARELLAHRVGGLRVGADGQADRGRGSRVGRAVHAAPEAGAQDARDEGQLGAAADHVEAGDVSAELTDARCVRNQEGLHGLDGRLHQRGRGLVEVCDRDRGGLAVNGNGDELRGGGEGLLGRASVLDEALPGGVSEQARIRAGRGS